jgi:hypothetical protein
VWTRVQTIFLGNYIVPKSSHLEEFLFCSWKTLQDSEKKSILFSLTRSQIWLIPFVSDHQSTCLKKLTQKKPCAKLIPDLYQFYMSFNTRYVFIYKPAAHQLKRSLGPNTKTIYWYESFLSEGSDTTRTKLLWKLSKVPKGQNQDQSGMFKSLISHQHSSKPYCKTLEIQWEQRLCTWRQSVCVLHIPHYDLLLWWSTVDGCSRKSLQYSQQFWLLKDNWIEHLLLWSGKQKDHPAKRGHKRAQINRRDMRWPV